MSDKSLKKRIRQIELENMTHEELADMLYDNFSSKINKLHDKIEDL